ncbi:MAG: carbohydrate kinase [Acidobacteria bacterium]|nr:carbohydrate kinase [Acidobacteriota bacterium]
MDHVLHNHGPVLPDSRALVAIDLGAESCRVSLLRWNGDTPEVTLVHRFPNGPLETASGLRWDIARICAGVEEGLRACAALASEGIASIAVDGWAVDYVRLGENGAPAGNPFCYRDERNLAAHRAVHARITEQRLYQLTGQQILPLNTLYQLYADSASGIAQSASWLNLPEYILHWLGGRRVSEYTNATHTALLAVHSQQWSPELFSAAGLEIQAAPPVVHPGADLGQLQGPLAQLPAFRDTRLIAPACHDTASAIAGIPAHGEDWAFLSSGTWSLLGCVLHAPQTSPAAQSGNFSNRGGVGGKIDFLKNVNGLWILRQCLESWQAHGDSWEMDALLAAAAKVPPPPYLLDVDDPSLMLPGHMPARINAQLAGAGHAAIANHAAQAPVVASLIFHSLAARYAAVLRDVMQITGKKLTRLFIVGGGSKNTLLNQLTAQATGMQVVLGPAECTTLGNFAVQLAARAGHYNQIGGVTSQAVAQFAQLLAGPGLPRAASQNSQEPERVAP